MPGPLKSCSLEPFMLFAVDGRAYQVVSTRLTVSEGGKSASAIMRDFDREIYVGMPGICQK